MTLDPEQSVKCVDAVERKRLAKGLHAYRLAVELKQAG